MSWLSPTEEEREDFDSLEKDCPMVRFARHLSPAIRIDTTLLRNMRLRYFHRSDASLESELWFSSLVTSRSARVISFKPGVARLLTDDLDANNQLTEITGFIESQILTWPRELRLEQQLRLAARNEDKQAIQGLLQRVLNWFEHSAKDSERAELLRWIRAALPDLIKPQWQIPETQWLMQLAAATLGDASGSLARNTHTKEGLPGWLHKHIERHQQGQIGLNIRPGQIEFTKDGEGRHDLPVGRIIPALLGIQEGSGNQIRWERAWPGKVVTLRNRTSQIVFTTITGQQYELVIDQEPGPNARENEQKLAEKIYLYHLKEESKTARTLAKRLKDLGITLILSVYRPDDPPRIITDNARFIRLWTSHSAHYFTGRDISTISSSELIARMDKTPLPAGQQNIKSIDLFDEKKSLSDSGVAYLKDLLSGGEQPMSVWLSWTQAGRELALLLHRNLQTAGIACKDHSTVHILTSEKRAMESEIIDSDVLFVVHQPENWALIKGDRRIIEADTARMFNVPVIHVSEDNSLTQSDLYKADERIMTFEELKTMTPYSLHILLESWRHQQAENRPKGIVYISYAQEDRNKVNRLTRLLKDDGWNVQIDQELLHPGKNFAEQLEEIVYRSACIIACWSDASLTSEFIINESSMAAIERHNLISIVLEPMDRIDSELMGDTIVNFMQWNDQRNSSEYRKLISAIKKIMHNTDEMRESLSDEEDGYNEERAALLAEIENPATTPERRLEIGDRLDEIGDPRPGVGTIEIEVPEFGEPVPESQVQTLTSSVDELLAELDNPDTKPERRLQIGDELNDMPGGDPRFGVGLNADGWPEIDWVNIPVGKFIYGEGSYENRRYLDAFEIARYPVTNTQYQAFVDDKGYEDERWWQGLRKPQLEPSHWPQGNRPRTNVDWYEATAFARWLSYRLGYTITLPHETQWERAARGQEGRAYPWGAEYLSGYANVDEKGKNDGPHYLEQTTAVGVFRHAQTPEGILDLSGNVREWCSNDYYKPDEEVEIPNSPVLRGGSWDLNPVLARAAYRFRRLPGDRYFGVGFRLLRSPPS